MYLHRYYHSCTSYYLVIVTALGNEFFLKITFFQKHGGKFKSVESNLWMAFLNFPSSYTSLLTFRVKYDKTRGSTSILKDISKKMMWRILCQLFWLLPWSLIFPVYNEIYWDTKVHICLTWYEPRGVKANVVSKEAYV